MLNYLKKRGQKILILIAIVTPFILFSSQLTPWSYSSWFFHLGQEIAFPFQYGMDQGIKLTRSIWNNYIYLVSAAKENEQLNQTIQRLQVKQLDYEHQKNESKRLRELLNFAESYKHQLSLAEVIGFYTRSSFQSIRISKRADDQLQVGMPVIAAHGIVGKIIRIGKLFADVQLLSDANFYLDALVERTRLRGVLRGIATQKCHLNLHKRANIKIGDHIITSGIIGGFPKGLPIGRVVKINYETDNVTQVITVQPWVDYHSLEEVAVLKRVDEEVQAIQDIAGSQWLNNAYSLRK